ncbi:hypothetical protein [Bacteroides sp.]|uniref:hypothetical protein n=1 Tax=Bacteroides sp. TaxID=29523 RepID=UPI0025BE8FD2|nr:hypothetical protein [Bacteroides sp.]
MDIETKCCPYCGEKIHKEAYKCKHCGEWLTEETKKAADIKKIKQEKANFEKWKAEREEKQKQENNITNIIIGILSIVFINVLFWGGIALIIHYTVPSDKRMEHAIIKDMQECVRDKMTSYTNLLLGEETSEIASLFFDSGVSNKDIVEQFKKNNTIIIESKWLWSVGKIYNRQFEEDGTMVCFGFLGIVIPFVEWDDFILMD